MKLKIIRDTVCGMVPVYVGDVVEASGNEAAILIGLGKAIEFSGAEKMREAAMMAKPETAVQPQPRPVRRKRKPTK